MLTPNSSICASRLAMSLASRVASSVSSPTFTPLVKARESMYQNSGAGDL